MSTIDLEEVQNQKLSAPTLEEISNILKAEELEDTSSEENELSDGKQLERDLLDEHKNLFDIYDKATLQKAFTFAESYKDYIDASKTEREAVKTSIAYLQNLGFTDINKKETLVPGDKVFSNIQEKGLMAAIVGDQRTKSGFAILGAHIDSPRFDLKPQPLYEEADMAFFKTHYYGGVKKYQWTTIPLALHGVVVRQDGSVLDFVIGEEEDDPVFMLTDLLIHLSADQMQKSAAKVVEGEELNILIGGRPLAHKDVSKRFKLAILKILHDKYGIRERDLISAEIEAVPANKARDLGFDRSFIAAYGHDDRVCAYPALRAIADQEKRDRTVVLMLTDKEEVGSTGNTGAESQLFENFLIEIMEKSEENGYNELAFVRALSQSEMLSTDVTAGFDPNFPSVMDSKNSNYMGHGVGLIKYTGSRGKGGCNDANSEFFAKVIRILDEAGIPWQTGELGKVDQGGGGTIAGIYANRGIHVLDCGVPVLNMHAPVEIIHKLDLYNTYQAYRVFVDRI